MEARSGPAGVGQGRGTERARTASSGLATRAMLATMPEEAKSPERPRDDDLAGLWFMLNVGLILLAAMTLDSGWIGPMLARISDPAIILMGIVAGAWTRSWRILFAAVGAGIMDEVVRTLVLAGYRFEPWDFLGGMIAAYLWAGLGVAIRGFLKVMPWNRPRQ